MFPTATNYLARLPRGADSYPEALTKGTVIRSALEDPRFRPTLDGLPAVAEKLVRDPPPVGAWVPEVHFQTLMAAIYDSHFASVGGHAAFEAWTYERNRVIFRSPLYRVLFLVVSPDRVLVGAPNRWSAFHRGSQLVVEEAGAQSAVVHLTYPARIMLEPCAHAYGGAFRAALAAAGGKLGKVTCAPESETATRFDIEWT